MNIRSYELVEHRDFKLPYYRTNYLVKTEAEVLDYISFYMSLGPKLKRYYRKLWPVSEKKYFEHLKNGYDPRYKKARQGYFYGYWAHEDYFREIESVVRKELVLKKEYLTEQLSDLQNETTKINSVAIHIRRENKGEQREE